MSLSQSQKPIIDPNILQQNASSPEQSVWVSASAGTGKTKVLTDRVLRLLLPRSDGQAGTPAHKILCLTFTKAAASEMALRIQSKLGSWAIMDALELRKVLNGLLGQDANDEQLMAARRLFAENIDSGSGLRVMTMHSFCQSVLGRFPLEAGLSPYSEVLDEVASGALLQEAQNFVLSRLQSDELSGSRLSDSMHNLLSHVDHDRFLYLISNISSERNQFKEKLQHFGSVDAIYIAICEFYKIDSNLSEEKLSAAFCACPNFDALSHVADILLQDKAKSSQKAGMEIKRWLQANNDERLERLTQYRSVFLKQDGEIRTHNFPTKAVLNAFAGAEDVLRCESARLSELVEQEKAFSSARFTSDLLRVGEEVIDYYETLKRRKGVLDFDDLVLYTRDLLEHKSEWVMYKLDEGLDHILVDEAQDTNPEQWGIVQALCSEFFDGLGARDDVLRTSFTVGDIKQSIYSFQRAAPVEFQRVQKSLDEKIRKSGLTNNVIELETSFRTTKPILDVVDRLFQDDCYNSYVGGGAIQHVSYRQGQAGTVELWPLIESEGHEARDPWQLPEHIVDRQSASVQLAEKITLVIKNWLDRKEVLESYDRAIQPGDIMILVKSRNAFVENLMRSLKVHNVPVAGSDRMILNEQLVVQDLISMARFCLLPEDDLSLAEVLKSPFIGFDEHDLFYLSYNRNGTLWSEICNLDIGRLHAVKDEIKVLDHQKRERACQYLAEMIGRCRQMNVYEFFSFLISQSCPAHENSGLCALKQRLGDDIVDPLQEFLSDALRFTHDDIDHMQLFLEHSNNQKTQIKRELEEGGDAVRIMTVHGSKGLQAPIVILPDMILSKSAKKPSRLLWPDKTGLDIPLYSLNKNQDPELYSQLYKEREFLDMQEYYRLLYVAMTRAEERLYLCGHVGSKGAHDHSWYNAVEKAMKTHPDVQNLKDGGLCVSNERTADPDKKTEISLHEKMHSDPPDWLQHSAPEEPLPPRPLVPSQPSLDEREVALSPLVSSDEKRFKRGNITHKLLQFLPDFDASLQENAAHKFVQKHAVDMSEMLQADIVAEVMTVLQHEEYAPFFAKGSMAEVPVTGLMKDGRIVSGQIDRLVVTETEIWILDYKSNRPPPQNPEDVQDIYKKQLIAYRDSLAQIYEGRTIHCALLWTDGPRFMIMDDVLD